MPNTEIWVKDVRIRLLTVYGNNTYLYSLTRGYTSSIQPAKEFISSAGTYVVLSCMSVAGREIMKDGLSRQDVVHQLAGSRSKWTKEGFERVGVHRW